MPIRPARPGQPGGAFGPPPNKSGGLFRRGKKCPVCNGRGKTGWFVKSTCDYCGGTGSVG
jgi:DnaJ-class molecular chaperone